jgi:hypothetical protein
MKGVKFVVMLPAIESDYYSYIFYEKRVQKRGTDYIPRNRRGGYMPRHGDFAFYPSYYYESVEFLYWCI